MSQEFNVLFCSLQECLNKIADKNKNLLMENQKLCARNRDLKKHLGMPDRFYRTHSLLRPSEKKSRDVGQACHSIGKHVEHFYADNTRLINENNKLCRENEKLERYGECASKKNKLFFRPKSFSALTPCKPPMRFK